MQIKREIISGLSTFFTMAYLLLLYPKILALGGAPFDATLSATAILIASSTLFLTLYSGYPAVTGPTLSVSTYLIFTVGATHIATLPQMLGLVFWAGLALFLLSVFGIRQKLLQQFPPVLKRAAITGLGLFFIAIGLLQLDLVRFHLGHYSWGVLGSMQQWIGLSALALLLFLYVRGVQAAFLLAILASFALALFLGLASWGGLFSLPSSPQLFHLDLLAILQPKLWGTLLTMLLIALFDSGATILALARQLNWLRADGTIRNLQRVCIPDGLASMAGSFLGITSCSFYTESSVGIRAGGRTWVTGFTAAFCCLISLFFTPLIASIPLFTIAPALIALGLLLALENRSISWKDPTEWVPFLATALAMPLFFSVYLGFAIGFITYVLLKLLFRRARELDFITCSLAAIFLLQLVFF